MFIFFVVKCFPILLFCMLMGISKVDSKQPSLSENPQKFCKYCKELANSDRFTNMLSKLQHKIPIDVGSFVHIHGDVNYTLVLSTLKLFVDKRKKRFFKLPVKADTVLNEAVECAIGIDQNGKNEKLTKECINLDRNFKAGLWKLKVIEPSALYKKCYTFPKSRLFLNMIGIVQNYKIPIDVKEKAAWGPEGTVSYRTNVLSAMNSFMHNLLTLCDLALSEHKEKDLYTHTEEKAILFLNKHQDFVDILRNKCDEGSIWGYPDTIEYALMEALECAIDVHQFQMQILAVKKGSDKMLPDAQKWAELDGEYWAELKKIWEPKEEKTDE